MHDDLESRLERIEETLANIPARRCLAGLANASIGAGGVLLKITGTHADSPTSGVRMYTGNVYGNGSEATPTATGVTIRIPGIAANVTLPSSGAWADVPVCGAVQTTATWTGAAYTHANDTIYEVIGLLLII